MDDLAIIRKITERAIARHLVIGVVRQLQDIPACARVERGESLLHLAIVREMADYQDRLKVACKLVLEEAQRDIEKQRQAERN